jgi:hypothetical protein
VPARQRWPVLDDISRGPQNPTLIDVPGHIIVRAENIKVSGRQLFDHEVDGLLRRPRGGGLFGTAFGGQSGKDETGDGSCRSGVPSQIRNGYGYSAQLPTRSSGEYTALGKLAEGEELGSNLLHGPTSRKVTQRSGLQAASQDLANDGRSRKGRQRPFIGPKHPYR